MIAGASASRDRLAAAAATRVRPRFALGLDAFVDRLQERDHAADPERLHLDDLYLATACADGDEAAWKEVADRHFGYIRAFARRFDLTESSATDVADGVIADLWGRGSIGRYRGRSALRTWLGAVVTHAALNAAGRERRHRRIEPELGREAADQARPAAEEREAAGALADAVGEALAALPPPDRLLVLLHYEQGLTLDQIGGMEGRSKATMSRTLTKVRSQLRDAIERGLAARHGTSWRELRPAVDLSRLDLDLASLLGR